MEYKMMAKYMQEKEVKLLLSFIFPDAELKYIKRQIASNFIEVYYEEYRSTEIKQVDFLPDEVYVHTEGMGGDGVELTNGDIMHQYLQFMVAKGYSDLWKANPYIC